MDFKQQKTSWLQQHQVPVGEDIVRKVSFLREIDQLKNVVRQNYNADGLRRENTAEHSWQIALMPMLFADLSNQPVDLLKVTQMLLIHDIVEIDAGDTYLYDETGYADKREREQKAAERIFGLLPAELGRVFNELWLEFEDGQSNEAKFAVALDNLMPELNNYFSGGKSWQEHGLTFQKVYQNKRIIAEGSESLWKLMLVILEKAKDEKLLPD